MQNPPNPAFDSKKWLTQKPHSITLRALAPLFNLYIFILILMPSGSVSWLNVKFIVMTVLALCLAGSFVLKGGTTHTNIILLVFVLGGICTLWLLVPLLYGFNFVMSLTQFKDILAMLIGCWLISVYCNDSQLMVIRFIRLSIYFVSFAGILKGLILLYSYRTGISVGTIIEGLSQIFHVQLMVVNFGDFGGRIQFLSDAIIPLCTFILLARRRVLGVHQFTATLFLIILSFSVFLSFSRFLWGFMGAAVILGIIFGWREKFVFVYVLLIAIAVPLRKRPPAQESEGHELSRTLTPVHLGAEALECPIAN